MSCVIKCTESDEVSQQFEEMKDTLGATNKSVNKSLAESKDTLLKGTHMNFVPVHFLLFSAR